MSDFFSQLTGFDPKYAEKNSAKQTDDTEETDYSTVDFCQGDADIYETDAEIFASEHDSKLKFFEEDDYDNYTGFDTEG